MRKYTFLAGTADVADGGGAIGAGSGGILVSLISMPESWQLGLAFGSSSSMISSGRSADCKTGISSVSIDL